MKMSVDLLEHFYNHIDLKGIAILCIKFRKNIYPIAKKNNFRG